ncbi:MAG: DUF6671 family protein [Chthoniobacterales bacterium]
MTKHAKEQAIAPRFALTLGAKISLIDTFDTDTLGTFTREVPRFGSQLDAARKKAELAIEISGCPLGLGSEGSFTPGPFGLGSFNLEVITLVDRTRGLEITGAIRELGHQASGTFEAWDPLADFAQKMKFPSHALVVRPSDENDPRIRKDLTDWDTLRAAFDECLANSERGAVFVESDLRAHRNPTRMRNIGAACEDLIARMLRFCPSCESPGFGLSRLESGLPCSWCGAPTNDWKAEEFRCVSCTHIESRPRQDRTAADPGHCPRCNP